MGTGTRTSSLMKGKAVTLQTMWKGIIFKYQFPFSWLHPLYIFFVYFKVPLLAWGSHLYLASGLRRQLYHGTRQLLRYFCIDVAINWSFFLDKMNPKHWLTRITTIILDNTGKLYNASFGHGIGAAEGGITKLILELVRKTLRLTILHICHYFYTSTLWGLKILHSNVRKFATRTVSRQNSVNWYFGVKTHCVKAHCV